MIVEFSPKVNGAYRFSVAPMLDCTDRHFRVLMRQISRRALLYTEMIVAKALLHTNHRNRLLDFDLIEHPISLQIGGDDPKSLAEKISEIAETDDIVILLGAGSITNWSNTLVEELNQYMVPK